MNKNDYVDKALEYYRKSDYHSAGYYIYKSIEIEPENTKLLFASAKVYSKLYDYDNCLKQLLAVQRIDSNYPTLNESISNIQAKLKSRCMNQQYG